jgi:hypothetical protein
MQLRRLLLILIHCIVVFSSAQTPDSTKRKKNTLPAIYVGNDSSLVFTGNKFINASDSVNDASLKIDAYISVYYAHYDDEITSNGFVQFPTMAARNDQAGLNMALLNLNYKNKKIRGNLGIHFGDIAMAAWDKELNMIQEAYAGVQILKGLWLDAGMFRSHLGVESVQPRENITSSMSIVDDYEPYFFSGAKLTYAINTKISLQVNAFNSYNSFIDNNKNKLLGFSAVYDPVKEVTLTYNFITGDETPDSINMKHQRFYNNFYVTYKHKKLLLALELNYGFQRHSLVTDHISTANLYSGLLIGKYQLFKKLSFYGRGEYFSDESSVLTGAINTGKYICGATAGMEYKPYKTCAISAEWRGLQSDKLIFRQKNYMLNQRNEVILCLDLWF